MDTYPFVFLQAMNSCIDQCTFPNFHVLIINCKKFDLLRKETSQTLGVTCDSASTIRPVANLQLTMSITDSETVLTNEHSQTHSRGARNNQMNKMLMRLNHRSSCQRQQYMYINTHTYTQRFPEKDEGDLHRKCQVTRKIMRPDFDQFSGCAC